MVQAVDGVGGLGRQLVSFKTEVIKVMKAPSGIEEVEKLRGNFEEVKLEVARLAEHPAYTEGGMMAWREVKEGVQAARRGRDSPGGSWRLAKDPGTGHGP